MRTELGWIWGALKDVYNGQEENIQRHTVQVVYAEKWNNILLRRGYSFPLPFEPVINLLL